MINYNLEMEKQIGEIRKTGNKPTLLLHSCCAPCSSSVIERLMQDFTITVFYYNPNIDGKEEFDLRAKEQQRLCDFYNINCIIQDYNVNDFLGLVNGLEKEKEGGARCTACYGLRLDKTATVCREKGFEYFTTTLTVSPLKDAKRLNEIGERLAKERDVKFLPSDFKKKGGYLRSIQLSKEFNLYRQNYCGCKYSKQPTE